MAVRQERRPFCGNRDSDLRRDGGILFLGEAKNMRNITGLELKLKRVVARLKQWGVAE